jgi:hypothetical protein
MVLEINRCKHKSVPLLVACILLQNRSKRTNYGENPNGFSTCREFDRQVEYISPDEKKKKVKMQRHNGGRVMLTLRGCQVFILVAIIQASAVLEFRTIIWGERKI